MLCFLLLCQLCLFVVYFLCYFYVVLCFFFFFQAEDGIRDRDVTGVQTCALPIYYFSFVLENHLFCVEHLVVERVSFCTQQDPQLSIDRKSVV